MSIGRIPTRIFRAVAYTRDCVEPALVVLGEGPIDVAARARAAFEPWNALGGVALMLERFNVAKRRWELAGAFPDAPNSFAVELYDSPKPEPYEPIGSPWPWHKRDRRCSAFDCRPGSRASLAAEACE